MKLTPTEFIKELDKLVIAQADAKKTLSIALRNRWRRTQLADTLSKQITPKNILLMGSTGVGKTAIIRALAELVDAPMVKVEATKYTQVGYVGESVNQMIEALAVEGYSLYNKHKQSKYTNKNDYNGFLLVKKANILIKEMENIVRKKLNKVYDDFYSSDVVDIKLEKANAFYDEEDIKEFNKDYLENDYRLIDWLFNNKLVSELLMVYLDYVPKRLLKDVKTEAKRVKYRRELISGLTVCFEEDKLLNLICDLILSPSKIGFHDDSKRRNINESIFRKMLKELEGVIDPKFLAYYQTYINYVHHFLDEEPFIYDDLKPIKKSDEKEITESYSSITKFKDHVQYTENMGIIFIDEIDKLGEKGGGSQENIGKLGVQRDLLAILDGTTVSTSKGAIKTDNILFIAAGAFHVSDVTDLMPELLGRLPIQVKLEEMNKDILENILRTDNLSPINQYIQLLSVDNIKVELEEGVIRTIAKVTDDINRKYRNMGARTLHLVVDKLFADYAVEVADSKKQKKISVTVSDIKKIEHEYAKKNIDEIIKKYIELKTKVNKTFF